MYLLVLFIFTVFQSCVFFFFSGLPDSIHSCKNKLFRPSDLGCVLCMSTRSCPAQVGLHFLAFQSPFRQDVVVFLIFRFQVFSNAVCKQEPVACESQVGIRPTKGRRTNASRDFVSMDDDYFVWKWVCFGVGGWFGGWLCRCAGALKCFCLLSKPHRRLVHLSKWHPVFDFLHVLTYKKTPDQNR